MRPAHTAALVSALLAAAPARAGVEITTAGDRLSVTAVRVPVAEVLDGLARKTRMKVVYEGATPRTLVSVELHAQTPAQAVLGVLEGLGLNFALILDPSGTHVETLMIVGAAATGGGGSTGTAAGASHSRSEQASRASIENAEMVDDDEPPAMEVAAPAEPHDVPKEPPKPSPLPTGPINPTTAYPNSPFAPPAKPPAPAASPAPSPPSQ